MELNILKDEKDKLILEIDDSNATMAAAVKNELWKDQKIKATAFNRKHPLVGKPQLIVEGSNPKELLKEAAKRVQKELSQFEKDFSKEC